MTRVAATVAAALLLAGCGSPSGPARDSARVVGEEDPNRLPPEAKLELPAFPQDADLIQFYPGPLDSHRYYIDGKTLQVGADRIVRYAVVMRTSGGATNVTYEGIRCQTREKRLYAIGYPGKGWVAAKQSDWQPIQRGRVNEHQSFLYSEYFCTQGSVPVDRRSILGRLRQGLSGSPPIGGDR